MSEHNTEIAGLRIVLIFAAVCGASVIALSPLVALLPWVTMGALISGAFDLFTLLLALVVIYGFVVEP